MACLKQLMKDILATTPIGVVTELEEKRRQQAAEIALGLIVGIEVIISNKGRPIFSHVLDILNDGRADQQREYLMKGRRGSRTKERFFPTPAGE